MCWSNNCYTTATSAGLLWACCSRRLHAKQGPQPALPFRSHTAAAPRQLGRQLPGHLQAMPLRHGNSCTRSHWKWQVAGCCRAEPQPGAAQPDLQPLCMANASPVHPQSSPSTSSSSASHPHLLPSCLSIWDRGEEKDRWGFFGGGFCLVVVFLFVLFCFPLI